VVQLVTTSIKLRVNNGAKQGWAYYSLSCGLTSGLAFVRFSISRSDKKAAESTTPCLVVQLVTTSIQLRVNDSAKQGWAYTIHCPAG
jgi:hypothetical protein